MSDESPWGAPPPSNPYGPPPPPQGPQTPQQPTPAYPQPGGGGYGGNQPPYGGYGGPGGPGGHGGPPPKKKTGLIVGIVLAVVVVVAAFVVTIVVTSGGDDDDPDEARTSDTGSPTESSDTASTETTESTEPTESGDPTDPEPADPTASELPDGVFGGEGYTFTVPTGWADASAEADGIPNAQWVDAIIVLGSSLELSQSNVIVEALSAGAADAPEDLENLWKRNLASSDNPTITDNDGTTIDGERAIGVTIDGRTNAGGIAITQLCYLVLHDGRQYSIGLTFPKENDDVSQGDFEAMLSSWSWTS